MTGTVLALRALGLGDALTGVPALRGLRRAFPGARLVLAGPAGIGAWLLGLGVVDGVLPTQGLTALRWRGDTPDVAVNLHGRGPQSHELLTALRPGHLLAYAAPLADAAPRASLVPPAGAHEGLPWPASAHEVERWCALVRSVGGACGPQDLRLPAPPRGHHVVLHPGAAFASRRWPASRWATVARALAEEGRRVVVTGTPAEAQLCAEVVAAHPHLVDGCGRYDLPGLARLVGSASLLLCGDTGVAHLATAFSTPSVLLFGPVSPRQWGPLLEPELHTVLWHPLPDEAPGDPHGDDLDPRLGRVEVEEVLAAAQALSRPPAALP